MNDDDARPKTIGEILDRAITADVRAFVPLFVIAASAVIPTLVLELALLPGFARIFDSATPIVPGAGTAADNERILRSFGQNANGGAIALIVLAFLTLYTLANSTMLAFAAARLDGAPIGVAGAYRAAFPRWLPQIVVAVAYVAFAFVAVIGFALLVFVLALIGGAVYALSHPTGIVAGIILGVVAFAAFVIVYALLYIAWQMSAVSVVTEDAHAIRAIGRGLRRALDRGLLRRSLLVAIALLAIDVFGAVVFLAFGALAASLVHVPFVAGTVSSIGGIALWGLRALFVLVYARDVRVRREGADLLAATADTLAPA